MKILVITGGNSSERMVSLSSAENVKKSLTENSHKVKLYDLKNGFEPIKKLAKDHDILFPVLHGEEGEGGALHKYLSKIDKPIVGTRNHKGMQQSWYKIPFKEFCDEKNIPTANWVIVKSKKDIESFGFPCVLKTSNGGSSREVAIIKNKFDLSKKNVGDILKNKKAYIEKYIQGTEITVGILDNQALPILEIKPTKDSWFSYKTKYDSSTKEIINAPSVDIITQDKSKNIALAIHKYFDLGSYSRIDFIVKNNVPYVLELNTIPGLTSESLLPKQAKAAGYTFPQFLEILINLAK